MKKKLYIVPQTEEVQLMAMGLIMGSTPVPDDPGTGGGAPIAPPVFD